MINEVGIGVVGTGGWASDVHLPAYQDHLRARLVGVYDVDESMRIALNGQPSILVLSLFF